MQFILLDLSGNGLEGFRDLGWFQSSLTVHASFFTSFQCQCCTTLYVFPGAETRTFSPEKCCLTSICPAPTSSPAISCSFSQYVISSNPGLAPPLSVHETYTSALYLLVFYTGKTLFTKKHLFFFVLKLSNFFLV